MKRLFRKKGKWPSLLGICVFAALLGPFPPSHSLAQTPAQIHGRACLMVEEVKSEFSPFDNASKPGPGKRLTLYAEADADCIVLVAALDEKGRTLVGGWMPELAALKAWEEIRLPSGSWAWPWDAESQEFEMHVVFADPKAKGLEPLRQLVEKMQQGHGGKLLEAQGRKFREDLMGWMNSSNSGIFHAGRASTAWGGTLRAGRPPWRASAQNVAFPAGRQAVLIYRYGR